MKTNKILSAITAAIVSISALGFYATAWTKPEYGFDYEALVSQYYDNCYFDYCVDSLYIENAYEFGHIIIFLKCEYSYFNSEWTIEDFPEIEKTGVKIGRIVNPDARYADMTDEEIQEHLKEGDYNRHTRIYLYYEDGYNSEINEAKVGSAIVDACRRGKHPEIAAIIFDTDLYKPTPVQECDINADGRINFVDATMVARSFAGNYELDDTQLEMADVNGDRKINIIDAVIIARFAVGMIDSY